MVEAEKVSLPSNLFILRENIIDFLEHKTEPFLTIDRRGGKATYLPPLGLVILLILVFLGAATSNSFRFLISPHGIVAGRIIDVQETSCGEDSSECYVANYSYEIDGARYMGRDTVYSNPSIYSEIPVVYILADPRISRIESDFAGEILTLLIVIVIPTATIYRIGKRYLAYRRRNRFVTKGNVLYGSIIRIEGELRQANNDVVSHWIRVIYSFTTLKVRCFMGASMHVVRT